MIRRHHVTTCGGRCLLLRCYSFSRVANSERGPRPGQRQSRRAARRFAHRGWRHALARPRALFLAIPVVAVAVVAIAAASGFRLFTSAPTTPPSTTAIALTPGSDAKFSYLVAQHSNFCSLSQDTVKTYPDSDRIQGACCNPLDATKYRWQVSGLRKYSTMAEILTDPYDVPASLAKQLLAADASVTLTSAQEAVFNQAKTMTHDHGWCCCQCWRWYMSEGLAKVLVTKYHTDAALIAHVVDLTNGCGGALGADASPSPSNRS